MLQAGVFKEFPVGKNILFLRGKVIIKSITDLKKYEWARSKRENDF